MTPRTTLSARPTRALLSLSLVVLGCSEVATPGDAAADVPGACNARHDVPTMAIRTVCDGIGVASCEQVAAASGAGLRTYATCIAVTNVCVFADRCASLDVASCRCGTEPPCHEGEVCAAGAAGGVPHCACLGAQAP